MEWNTPSKRKERRHSSSSSNVCDYGESRLPECKSNDINMNSSDTDTAVRTLGAASFVPNAKIAPLPIFEASRYSSWKRELKFRCELHIFIPEAQLLAFIGLPGGAVLRSHAMKFYRDAGQTRNQRSIAQFLLMMGKLYEMTSKERSLRDMDNLFNLKRESTEYTQSFWNRFDTSLMLIDDYEHLLSDDILFYVH